MADRGLIHEIPIMADKCIKERKKEEIITKTEISSYYLSLTKVWIPPFPAATLSEMATMTAGKPAVKQGDVSRIYS